MTTSVSWPDTPHRTLSFAVHGTPEPAGSKRAFIVNKGKPWERAIVTDANKNAAGWKDQVAQEAGLAMRGQPLFRVPLLLQLTFLVRRPKGHYGTGRNAGVLKPGADTWPAKKPDVLKLARGVEDALSGVVYGDDAQIVRELLEKRYTEGAEGVEITVMALEEEVRQERFA